MPCALPSLKNKDSGYLESSKAQGGDLLRRTTVLVKMGRATLLSPPCEHGANKADKADPEMQNARYGRLTGSSQTAKRSKLQVEGSDRFRFLGGIVTRV